MDKVFFFFSFFFSNLFPRTRKYIFCLIISHLVPACPKVFLYTNRRANIILKKIYFSAFQGWKSVKLNFGSMLFLAIIVL